MSLFVSIASLVATAVGTGVSYMAQKQQAAQQSQIAQYNYSLATQQAQMQAQIASQQAAANSEMLAYQAQVQQGNATAYLQQADAVTRNYNASSDATKNAAELSADRERENARRFLALQTAKVGASGLQLAGTPLDSLADAANVLELQAQDVFHQGELEARKLNELGGVESYRLRGAADSETQKSAMSLFQAANERWSGAVAQQKLKLDMYGAEVSRIGGQANASGYRAGAAGTLFTGIANLGTGLSNLGKSGAFTAS